MNSTLRERSNIERLVPYDGAVVRADKDKAEVFADTFEGSFTNRSLLGLRIILLLLDAI